MAEFINAIDLRKGQTIIWKNELYMVLEHSFNKTAMRGGIVKCKVRNISTNAITVEDFSGIKFEKALINKIEAIYSYSSGGILHFLDKETYVDIEVSAEKFEDQIKFLEENMEVNLSMYEGEVLYINLPDIISLSIEKFDDDLPDSEHKKAITNTGLVVIVPKFCNVGERINISTSDGKYKSR